MSAFMVSDEQISIILNGAVELDLISDFLSCDYGRILVEENIQSLLSRYKNDKRADYEHEYVHNFNSKADLEQVYKYAKCFDYQASEHKNYEESFTKYFIDKLCAKIAETVPNFDETIAMNAGNGAFKSLS